MKPLIARAERLLDAAVVSTSPVAGGDIAVATRLRLSDGTTALMKTLPSAPADLFALEAAGLQWLGEVDGGVGVPAVLGVDSECLILRWVEPGKTSTDAAIEFGQQLATTHAAGAPRWGAERDGYIGRLPLPNRESATWAEFFATRRVLPYLKLARDRDAITPEDAKSIDSLVGRFPELIPTESPARLHGDLWNGNCLWAHDGAIYVVDPAAYGGHREMDLAMLSLFGLPHLPSVLASYHEATPLADGWEDRLPLHQLFPLLVHACMFGGRYGARAGDIARSFA